MILLVAILHAVPLLLVPVFSSRMTTLNTVAIIMSVIAVASGSGQYIAIDLVAVTVGYFVAMSFLPD